MTEREAPPIDEIVDEKPRLDETGMASMPLDSVLKFEPEDRRMMDMLLKAADERLASEYAQLFEIEAQFISKVRQRLPVAAGGGYARNANGSYVEDWTQLTLKDMEEFVLAATQYIVFDSQQSINAQAERLRHHVLQRGVQQGVQRAAFRHGGREGRHGDAHGAEGALARAVLLALLEEGKGLGGQDGRYGAARRAHLRPAHAHGRAGTDGGTEVLTVLLISYFTKARGSGMLSKAIHLARTTDYEKRWRKR